ncbi:MAG: UvrD-helicase domain-containing protein [Candidatus Omnitrophica bacterium]|nr:UvrD-helicase domain-containing protein [Candidatus Omnitrophota bacterium]
MGFKNLLNPQQYEAVTHGDGPLLVLAGAGSGKTRVIAYRIAYLIKKRKIAPSQILGVTFTNKAANEMRERIAKLVGKQAAELTLGTFHSLGLKILREHGKHIGYRSNFTIYNEGDQLSLVRTLIREHPQKREKFDAGLLLSRISSFKNKSVDGASRFSEFGDKYDLVFSDVFQGYQQQLRACQAVDFDDLILLPIRILTDHADIRREYLERFQHLLVDEYQDTNHGQYCLIRLLAGKKPNLCVVGDDDQSIYAWRGAEVRNILQFSKDFPNAKAIKLEQNYRSTQVILDAAYHVIKNNSKRQEKRLWTDRGRGRNIDAFIARDENDEAKTIAWRIQAIQENTKAPWGDFAVLYRSNVQSRAIESALRIAKIPYEVVGGYEFFERKEIKDIVAYLRVINNPRDDLSLLRIVNVPRRGIGGNTIVKLTDAAHEKGSPVIQALRQAKNDDEVSRPAMSGIQSFVRLIDELHQEIPHQPVPDLVRMVIERSGYREELERTIDDAAISAIKVEMVEEIASAAAAFAESQPKGNLMDFIDTISLGDEPNQNGKNKRRKGEAVLLATLHSSKGLEFPYVFLCGLEEKILPHARSLKDNTDVDEERRLCYVGMTRARRHLTLSFTQERVQFGRRAKRIPSRFLKEISPDLLCKQFSHSPFFFHRQKLPDASDSAEQE